MARKIETVQDLIQELKELDPRAKVSVFVECKACYGVNVNNRITFYRIDKYENKKIICKGYKCRVCGYLNKEE